MTSYFWNLALCLLWMTSLENLYTYAFQKPLTIPARKCYFRLKALTGEDALTSRTLARRIRNSRTNRGRVTTPNSKRRPTSRPATNRPVKLIKKKKQNMNRPMKGFHLPYEYTIEALRSYHAIHGDLAMPQRFIVPEDSDYPEVWHGKDLASTVYDMEWWQKHVKQNPDHVADLNRLGFIWERLQTNWNLVLEALVTYSSFHGDVMVPIGFVVPHGDTGWPKATWGIHLGRAVYQIRARNDFIRGSNAASRRLQLDGLGFVWDVSDHRFRKFYQALRHFSKLEQLKAPGKSDLYKALRVPSTFVVPSGSTEWPEHLWDYPLGAKCQAVRSKELYIKNNPERQAALEELGFQRNGNATLGWLEVVHAAAIYSKMHNRHLDVPLKFVVPTPPHVSHNCNENEGDTCIAGSDEAWPWPEQLWGLPLGQRLKDIRVKGAYLKCSTANSRRAQLDALGFNWAPKRGRRKGSSSKA
mmetsp:Transcript_16324/g.23027  ORF Transcript_16324/g.23027 Transcript_16324/m.23027 type:complete len:470 (-) Transcript_16324:370-1779(-)